MCYSTLIYHSADGGAWMLGLGEGLADGASASVYTSPVGLIN